MKQVLFILMMAILSTACKKEKEVNPQLDKSAIGKWQGFVKSPNGLTTWDYAMELFSDGSMKIYKDNFNSVIFGTGTWTLDSYYFKASFSFPSGEKFSVTATRDANKLYNGTWGVTPSYSGYASWEMTKL